MKIHNILAISRNTAGFNYISRFIHWFNSDNEVLACTVLFFGISFLIPNNKSFFVLAAAYVSTVFILKKSIYATLLYCLIPFTIYGIGQTYVYNLIPTHVLKHPLYPEGRNISFVFSPFTVVALTGVLMNTFIFLRNFKKKLISLSELLFLAVFSIQIYSATKSEFYPVVSVLLTLSSFGSMALIFIAKHYFKSLTQMQKNVFISTLISICVLAICLQTMLATAQYVKRSSLGIKIESTADLPYNGSGADEDSSQVRPVGLTNHANILAFDVMNMWLFGFLLWIILEKRQKKRMGKILIMGFLCATVTIILTQSRSVYLSWFIICLLLIWKSDILMINRAEIIKLLKRFKPIILVCIPIVAYLVVTRALYTLESFNLKAGGGTRDYLIKEAQQLILKNPLIGVGASMFIPAAFEQNSTKVMNYFPESVHNGFLLFIAESGFIAFIFYLCGMCSLIWIAKKSKHSGFFLATMIVVLANFIVMLFQPFAGILPLAVIGIFFAQYALQNTQKNPFS